MPVAYPILNIAPADPASHYISGINAGVAIASARNSVALQAARIAAEERQQEMANQRAQQQMLIEQAQQSAALGLRKSALDLDARKIDLAAQSAAQRFSAQQQYQSMVQQGADPAQALLRVGPALGLSAGDLGNALRSTRPERQMATKPEFGTSPEGTEYAVMNDRVYFPPHKASLPDNLQNGAIQGVPVINPYTGQPETTVMGVPTGTGGYSVRNISDRSASRAMAQIKQMESGPFGIYLTSGRTLPADADPSRQEAFSKAKTQYDRLQKVVSGESDSENAAPNEVIRLTKDGRRAVFDADTKNFLRYDDQ